MARVTVEDCLAVVPNRFELIMLASRRARQLHNGVEPLLDNTENDKPTVLALREIAAGKIDEDFISRVEKEEKARRDRDALDWVSLEFNQADAAPPSSD